MAERRIGGPWPYLLRTYVYIGAHGSPSLAAARLAVSLPLAVTVFERRAFAKRGPAGCNKCAGILSSHLVQGMAELGLSIPEQLVMARLTGYRLYVGGQSVDITQPAFQQPILSVYRGGGPLHSDLTSEVSFDAWLLDKARLAGAEVAPLNVRRVVAGRHWTLTDPWAGSDITVGILARRSPTESD